MRGMRYLTNVDHAYHSGVTNEEVIRKVEIILNKGEDLNITWEEFMRANDMAKMKHFTRLSETVMCRQNAILAPSNDDLIRGITMTDGLRQWQRSPKRVGRPREKWMTANCKYYWMRTYAGDFVYNQWQVERIIEDAMQHNF